MHELPDRLLRIIRYRMKNEQLCRVQMKCLPLYKAQQLQCRSSRSGVGGCRRERRRGGGQAVVAGGVQEQGGTSAAGRWASAGRRVDLTNGKMSSYPLREGKSECYNPVEIFSLQGL